MEKSKDEEINVSKSTRSKKTLNNKTNDNHTSLNHKFYYSYKSRVVVSILCFTISFIICLFFATKTIEREKLAPINYSQNGSTNYKVYLNENNFYTEEYLGMNRSYIANLIKYIDIDFNYLFSIEENTNVDFSYKINAELVIENKNGSSRYLEKEYPILNPVNKKLNGGKTLNINENIKIDYGQYNNIVNSFKSEYGVDINSYLNVYLEVIGNSDKDLNYKINEDNKVNLKIPLSEKSIEINLDSSNQNITKQVIPTGSIIFNYENLIVEVIFFIISCIFLNKIIKYLSTLTNKKTMYDKYVNKILKDYDRLIVETKSDFNPDDCNIINVKNFNELLDVRDNLKMPIIYSNIVKHQKGVFYIKNNNDIYLITIKNIDLENKKMAR